MTNNVKEWMSGNIHYMIIAEGIICLFLTLCAPLWIVLLLFLCATLLTSMYLETHRAYYMKLYSELDNISVEQEIRRRIEFENAMSEGLDGESLNDAHM